MVTTDGEQVSTQTTGQGSAGGPVRREGDQLRDELLAAATTLTESPRPVAIPSLRAVARACGVSATAVYRHFPSQSALTRAVLAAEDARFSQAVLGADEPGAEPVERLRRLAAAYVRWGAARPGLYQLLFESADRLDDDWSVGGTSEAMTGHVTALLTARDGAGPQDVPAALAAERLWVGLHGLVSLRLHKPGHPWVGDLGAEVDRLLEHLR